MTTAVPEQKSVFNCSFLRKFHWGIILICFFLPAVQGCNKEIVYPFTDFSKQGKWLEVAMYFYPLLFVFWAGFILKLMNPKSRFMISWVSVYVLLLALTYLLVRLVQEKQDWSHGGEWWYVSLVGIWGVMCFGLLRFRDERRIFDLLRFLLTSLALWVFPVIFLFSEKILYGGWLFIYANGFVILTYIWEFFQQRHTARPNLS